MTSSEIVAALRAMAEVLARVGRCDEALVEAAALIEAGAMACPDCNGSGGHVTWRDDWSGNPTRRIEECCSCGGTGGVFAREVKE